MYEMIELDSEGKIVDVVYASDEPIGVFLDKADKEKLKLERENKEGVNLGYIEYDVQGYDVL